MRTLILRRFDGSQLLFKLEMEIADGRVWEVVEAACDDGWMKLPAGRVRQNGRV